MLSKTLFAKLCNRPKYTVKKKDEINQPHLNIGKNIKTLVIQHNDSKKPNPARTKDVTKKLTLKLTILNLATNDPKSKMV